MHIDMAAERRVLPPVFPKPIRIKISHVASEPFVRDVVPGGVSLGHIGDEEIQRIHGGHAMALPHQPRSCVTRHDIRAEIAGIGRHHVERPAGVAIRTNLEVFSIKRSAVEMYSASVSLVHHEP